MKESDQTRRGFTGEAPNEAYSFRPMTDLLNPDPVTCERKARSVACGTGVDMSKGIVQGLDLSPARNKCSMQCNYGH